jgi:hypothetical protein
MDRIMEKFATPGPVSVVLDIPAGSVRLIGADRADTVVEVLPADASKRRDMKAAQQIEVGRDGVVSIAPPAVNRVLGSPGSFPTSSRTQLWTH